MNAFTIANIPVATMPSGHILQSHVWHLVQMVRAGQEFSSKMTLMENAVCVKSDFFPWENVSVVINIDFPSGKPKYISFLHLTETFSFKSVQY